MPKFQCFYIIHNLWNHAHTQRTPGRPGCFFVETWEPWPQSDSALVPPRQRSIGAKHSKHSLSTMALPGGHSHTVSSSEVMINQWTKAKAYETCQDFKLKFRTLGFSTSRTWFYMVPLSAKVLALQGLKTNILSKVCELTHRVTSVIYALSADSKCLPAVPVNLAAVGTSSRPTRETLTQLIGKKLGRQDLQRSLALIQFIATVAGLEKRPLRFPGVGADLQLDGLLAARGL